MNLRLVAKLLGRICLLMGLTMVFSLPWAFPGLGHRHETSPGEAPAFEADGFAALSLSVLVCFLVGGLLIYLGRSTNAALYRKEAMAVVGLSWALATVLGALPYRLSETYRSPAVRLLGDEEAPQVFDFDNWWWQHWRYSPPLLPEQERCVVALLEAGGRGLPESRLREATGLDDAPDVLQSLAAVDPAWRGVLIFPNQEPEPPDRVQNYRIRWVRMNFIDALFESQSGFSTTGATVMADVEDPQLVPHCILFWRSGSHFLGGLGIIVLFVAVLGQGSAGKALMRNEMPGPSKEGATSRMQHTAWIFAAIYCGLTLVLAVILMLLGLTLFDALCHSFGTLATGGFSTYNASVGHFALVDPVRGFWIEAAITVFMVLAGTNFTLLYLLFCLQGRRLLADIEWRTYMAIIGGVTLLVVLFGLAHRDFTGWFEALRYGLFQVVSILTTTGYGTHDFDGWNSFGRGVLFLLMFVGGCAGSTGGGLKVIRHVLFVKILHLEIEQSYHPTVVRPLWLGGKPVEDPNLRKNVLLYFGLILVIFVCSWLFVVTVEPDITWGQSSEHKLIDSASGVAATLNNIGPGLGTVGATQNYGHFSPLTKLLFTWLMMIGRLEVFAILVLFVPSFWRSH